MSLPSLCRYSRLLVVVRQPPYHAGIQRHISTSASLASGHNRWSKISRDKGVKDIEKGKLYSRTAHEIVVAAKRGGSVDPSINVQLAVCLRKARAAGVPKDNIEKALARAGDKSKQDSLTSLVYEAIGPGQTGFLIECQSDNVKRTNASINSILKDRGARTASVAYLFSRNGSITFTPKEGIDPDGAFEAALEVGAEDVDIGEDGDVQLLTPPESLSQIAEALQSHPSVLAIKDMSLIYRPNDPITFEESEMTEEEKEIDEAVGRVVEALEDNDDTVAVWTTRG